jgi:hypothetical protein
VASAGVASAIGVAAGVPRETSDELAEALTRLAAALPAPRGQSLPWAILAGAVLSGAILAIVGLWHRVSTLEQDVAAVAQFLVVDAEVGREARVQDRKLLTRIASKLGADVSDIEPIKEVEPGAQLQRRKLDADDAGKLIPVEVK